MTVDIPLRKGPSGVVTTGAGAGVSTMKWVDPATTLDPADQTGSAEAPFSTIQAAIDALDAASAFGGTVILADGDYDGETPQWEATTTNAVLGFVGYGDASNIGEVTLSGEAAMFVAQGIGNAGSEGSGGAYVCADPFRLVRFVDSFVGDVEVPDADTVLSFTGSHAAAITHGALSAESSTFSGIVAVDTADRVTGCRFDSDVSGALSLWSDCDVNGNIDAPSILFMSSCRLGNVSTDGICDLQYCSVGGSLTVGGDAGLRYCSTNAAVDVTGQLAMDSQTLQLAILNGAVSFGTFVYLDTPIAAVVTIAVPELASGELGYVSTTLVGTSLEGLLLINSPVLVNPESDNFPIGAYMIATNTLRVAFVGQIAGGNQNFTVTAIR